MDRPRHDEGTAAWGHDRAGANRDASVSEGITIEQNKQERQAQRTEVTTACEQQGGGGKIAALQDSRGRQ